MNECIINVSEIEDLQTIHNLDALRFIFEKAKKAIVHGSSVLLVRITADGETIKFDELTTEADLEQYRKTVFKYLK